jgi:hypothetical protein
VEIFRVGETSRLFPRTADSILSFGKSGFAGKDSPNQGPLPGAAEIIKAILENKTQG